jgi:hypothetical protein
MAVDDPVPPTGDIPAPAVATAPAMPAAPAAPTMPSMPSLGAAPLPGLGGLGGLPGLQDLGRTDPPLPNGDDERLAGPDGPDQREPPDDGKGDDAKAHDVNTAADEPEPAPSGPTTITLPDGDTVTAASPELAAAIKAAVGGAPIAQAFQQQGITIPPPGTAVPQPVDPRQVIPGDVGILVDRHALALGHEKALLDGQIQRIATVSGPSFLGWEHPPAAAAPAAPPAEPHTPTPTGPAATSTT